MSSPTYPQAVPGSYMRPCLTIGLADEQLERLERVVRRAREIHGPGYVPDRQRDLAMAALSHVALEARELLALMEQLELPGLTVPTGGEGSVVASWANRGRRAGTDEAAMDAFLNQLADEVQTEGQPPSPGAVGVEGVARARWDGDGSRDGGGLGKVVLGQAGERDGDAAAEQGERVAVVAVEPDGDQLRLAGLRGLLKLLEALGAAEGQCLAGVAHDDHKDSSAVQSSGAVTPDDSARTVEGPADRTAVPLRDGQSAAGPGGPPREGPPGLRDRGGSP